MNTDKHNAASPQPKEITPSLPSPLPVESLRVEREGEGQGGGDAFCLTKFKDFAEQ